MILVRHAEPEAGIEADRGLVALLDLEEDLARAALRRGRRERGGNGRAQPARRQAGATSIAVSPAQPAATETRPIAAITPSRHTRAKACHGADRSSARALVRCAAASGWPRKWYRDSHSASGWSVSCTAAAGGPATSAVAAVMTATWTDLTGQPRPARN